jgi:hypothetical protein
MVQTQADLPTNVEQVEKAIEVIELLFRMKEAPFQTCSILSLH